MKRLVPLLAAALMGGVAVSGMYVPVEIQQVPVERLLQNLERRLAGDEKNAQTLISLARLHGMAYALKTEQVDAAAPRMARDAEPSAWYGYEPNHIPYAVKQASDPEQTKRARAHLAQALSYYDRALEVEPANLLAALGRAWSLDQAGRKAEAIAAYRQVINRAWESEQKATMAGLGAHFFTAEAGDYLVKLLDPVADAAEIRTLQTRRAQLAKLPRPVTPIAVPLTDDKTTIVAPDARVTFDADGSGRALKWSWISPAAGWLVYDSDDRGRISSALQLFGSVTFWLFWGTGYEALASLDDDGDGILADNELGHLAVWHDRNSNGRSDEGEVRPLTFWGIVAVNCAFEPGDGYTFAAVSPQGVRLASGATRATYDVILRRDADTLTH